MGAMHYQNREFVGALAAFRRSLECSNTQHGRASVLAAVDLRNIGNCHRMQCHYDQAVLHYQHSRAIYERNGLQESTDYADLLRNHNGALMDMEKPAEALLCFTSAHSIYLKELPPDHPVLAGSLSSLAQAQDSLGNSDAAGEAYAKAVAVVRRLQTKCAGLVTTVSISPSSAPPLIINIHTLS